MTAAETDLIVQTKQNNLQSPQNDVPPTSPKHHRPKFEQIVNFFRIAGVIVTAIPLSIFAIVMSIFRSERGFHWAGWIWSKIILWLFRIKVDCKGLEHLEANQHYIYVSNHSSAFDIPASIVGIPGLFRFILKKELTKIPIFGWALKYGPYIVIDRSNAKDALRSIEEAAITIRNGKSVLIFAEGTRSRTGKLQPFKRGAFTLAVKSGVPIMPITINNSFSILAKGSLTIKRNDIELIFNKPIESKIYTGRDGENRLMEQTYSVIASVYKEPLK
jgi:1-acyl-sn-glycerol-3-phosphate acyltransferase